MFRRVCPDCGGLGQRIGNTVPCPGCKGEGHIFTADRPQAAPMSESAQQRAARQLEDIRTTPFWRLNDEDERKEL